MGYLTSEQHEQVCADYKSGLSMAEISRKFSVSEASIWKLLTKRGVHVSKRPAPAVSPSEAQQICTSYLAGETVEGIAVQFERSRQTICRILHKANVILTKAEGKKRHIPEEFRDKIVELYQTGMTADEIVALQVHPKITRAIVFQELRHRGLPSHRSGARGVFFGKPEQQKDIQERYQKGWSQSALADLFDCSPDAIKKVLRDAGIEIRNFDQQTGLKWADKSGRTFFMRSMWEIKTAVWLDNNGHRWDYELHSYDIGDDHTYTPDFWVYDDQHNLVQLLDVKGWARPKSEDAINKFKTVFSSLPFEQWNEADLQARGILDIKIPGDIEPGPSYPVCITKVSDDEKVEIARLYKSGLTIQETATKTGRSHTIVENVVAECKLTRPSAKSRLLKVPQQTRDEIAVLYAAGDSMTVVAKKLNVGRDIVALEIKRRGLTRSLRDAQKHAYAGGRGRWCGDRAAK